MKRLFLPLCLLFSLSTITAQDIMDQLGGIETNYTLQIDDQPLGVVDQFVTKRMRCPADRGCGEYYYFEFTLRGIRLREELKSLSYGRYRIVFLGEDGTTLAMVERTLNDGGTRRIDFDNDQPLGLSCYNVRLSGVPLTVLRHCRTITFVSRP